MKYTLLWPLLFGGGALSVLLGLHGYVMTLTMLLPLGKLGEELSMGQRVLTIIADLVSNYAPGLLFCIWWLSFGISVACCVNKEVLRKMLIPARNSSFGSKVSCALNWIVGQALLWSMLYSVLLGDNSSMSESCLSASIRSPLMNAPPLPQGLCLSSLAYLTISFTTLFISERGKQSFACIDEYFALPFYYFLVVLLLNFSLAQSIKQTVMLCLLTIGVTEVYALAIGAVACDWRLVAGTLLFASIVPFVAMVISLAMLWDFIDRLGRGKRASGAIFRAASWWESVSRETLGSLMMHPADGFFFTVFVLTGIIMPGLFMGSAYYNRTYGFSISIWLAYNVIRVGPAFQNFAYVYTLCHKEGHSRRGVFAQPYGRALNGIFNFWIGNFYGVLPSTFFNGHSRNHHQYNNDENDVISTWDRPRDSFPNYVAYIPRFFLYASNISTTHQFYSEGHHNVALKLLAGTGVFVLFAAVSCWYAGPMFMLAFVIYPFLESGIILSLVNWTWHAFVDPDNQQNDYASSLTILDGITNICEEDYHVVHHQYPGAHWTKHRELYEKHLEEYKQNKATCFRGTDVFELFGCIVARDYDKLTEMFVDLSGKMSQEEIRQLIVSRLQACYWGPIKKTTSSASQAVTTSSHKSKST